MFQLCPSRLECKLFKGGGSYFIILALAFLFSFSASNLELSFTISTLEIIIKKPVDTLLTWSSLAKSKNECLWLIVLWVIREFLTLLKIITFQSIAVQKKYYMNHLCHLKLLSTYNKKEEQVKFNFSVYLLTQYIQNTVISIFDTQNIIQNYWCTIFIFFFACQSLWNLVDVLYLKHFSIWTSQIGGFKSN